MEGLANFVSKSFEENTQNQNLNLETREKSSRCEDKVAADDIPKSTCKAHVPLDDEPKDLSLVKIDVCSSRPETPHDDPAGFESGKFHISINYNSCFVFFVFICSVAIFNFMFLELLPVVFV